MCTWIAITGLDGSGKTTLVNNLEKWLVQDKKQRVYKDRLPHDKYLVKHLLDISEDSYTDRLLFALDNRIFGTKLKKLMECGEYDIILTQRSFLDTFVHGSVQGYSYNWIEQLNRISELPRCNVLVHLVADADIAYKRIKDDPDADKFEYLEYITVQERETKKAYLSLVKGNEPALMPFQECKNLYIDTTYLTTEDVFKIVKDKIIL